jgi:hypothetical protein
MNPFGYLHTLSVGVGTGIDMTPQRLTAVASFDYGQQTWQRVVMS